MSRSTRLFRRWWVLGGLTSLVMGCAHSREVLYPNGDGLRMAPRGAARASALPAAHAPRKSDGPAVGSRGLARVEEPEDLAAGSDD